MLEKLYVFHVHIPYRIRIYMRSTFSFSLFSNYVDVEGKVENFCTTFPFESYLSLFNTNLSPTIFLLFSYIFLLLFFWPGAGRGSGQQGLGRMDAEDKFL